MARLKILEVSSEVAPFARTGGLGDVLGALPRALARLGHDVRVCLPEYGTIGALGYKLSSVDWSTALHIGGKRVELRVQKWRDSRARVVYYFIGNDHFFDRPDLYRDLSSGKDYSDNDERFVFFNRAVLQLVRMLEWKPDLIHVHDWQASLIPAYLKTVYSDDSFIAGTKTVLTIHNLGYQGAFDSKRFALLGLPDEYLYAITGPFEFFGDISFLKGGIVLADAITTVSPRYAQEIQSSEEFGAGLEGILLQRRDNLRGILNGVDYSIWSPSRDKKIPHRYTPANLSGKRADRVELLRKANLPIREKAPLIGMISRLADQKGWDLIAEAADQLFAMDLQMIVLGTGEEKYHRFLEGLQRKYPDKVRVYLTFDDTLAHWIEAGADIFLMPSRYEPCGLNQMYSLKYGTVPVVRAVGGLVDTVVDYNETTGEGTGFVFDEYTSEALVTTVKRAVDLFYHRRAWTKLMKAGMVQDFSWNKSAGEYAELFEEVTGLS